MREIRVVVTNDRLLACYGQWWYPRRQFFVVECEQGQRLGHVCEGNEGGVLCEHGVRLLWESEPFGNRGRYRGGREQQDAQRQEMERFAEAQRQEAGRVAEEERRKLHVRHAAAVGLDRTAPPEAVADLFEELGIETTGPVPDWSAGCFGVYGSKVESASYCFADEKPARRR
jgi:hypothetical protein